MYKLLLLFILECLIFVFVFMYWIELWFKVLDVLMLVYIVGLELEIEYFENLNKVKDFKKIVRFYWMILK